MQRAFGAKFNGLQPSVNAVNEDQKSIDHRVNVDWQYSDFKEIEYLQPNNRKLEEHDKDEPKNFTFSLPELKLIKLVLPGTLQRRIPLPVAVVLVMITLVYCFHAFGAFGDNTLIREEIALTLTTFKNIIWTLRVPVYTFFGFCYLKLYLDDIPSSFRLTSRSNLKILCKKIFFCCCLEVGFTVVFPAIARLVQMLWLQTSTEKDGGFDPETAYINTAFLVLARLIVLPILLNFIAGFYLLYYEVQQYKEDIQKWKEGQLEARNQFIDILKNIKKAEKTFQLFLVIHLGFLILIIIPGVLSYIERFNAEGTVNRIFLKQQGDRMSDPISFFDPGTMLMNNNSGAYELTKSGPLTLMIYLRQEQNKTMKERQQKVAQEQTKKVLDKKARERIILAALTFLGELLALYLPLILPGKINETLASIPHTIRYGLKYDEQQESGYLIQNDQVVKEMLKTIDDVEGFQILGMRLTVVKTVLIAVMAPLLTLLIHILIRDVDITP